MKDSIVNAKSLSVMLGLFFIGGGAALFGIYRVLKNAERPLVYRREESDGETFVSGAYA